MKLHNHILLIAFVLVALVSCSNSKKVTENNQSKEFVPEVVFDGDSAYSYVARQCSFGERVPNTDAHRKCGDYLAAELKKYGAVVTEQKVDLKAFDGTVLKSRNIVGEFYPEMTNRIVLLAHWDCRPWADNDYNHANQKKPVMGANDGASGVGVILEIARLLSKYEPQVGVDILFADAEDWGDSEGNNEESWAMGSRYWANNLHREGYKYPMYGILLDMVGAKEATFYREYFSVKSAKNIVNKVWAAAATLGCDSYFVIQYGGAMTDDHLSLINVGIPCIDIIDHRPNTPTGFFPHWHTVGDTMENISVETLKAVGQTVAFVIFEK